MTTNTRQQLLTTAARLFYRDGFRAVGVDTIVAESGVGKMTLYRHFSSKDDLIVAYLEEANHQFWAWFDEVTAVAATPRDKLIAFFVALEGLATNTICFGCPFLNVVVDFPDETYAGHQTALAHKEAVHGRFRQLAGAAGANQPELLADGLLLLMDGAFMAARLFPPEAASPARTVSVIARQLIDGACGGQP